MATVNGDTLNPAFFVAVAGRGFELFTEPATIPKGKRKRVILTVPFTLEVTGLPVGVQRPK